MQTKQGITKPTSNPGTLYADITDIRYFIDAFIFHQKSQHHSPETVSFYARRLPRLVWFLENHGYPTTLADITPSHLRHFLIYLSEQNEGRWGSDRPNANRPLSPATIHIFARILRAFFRWATKEAMLPRNPFETVSMPTQPNQWRVETYTDDEIAAMFSAVDAMGHAFTVQRNRAILAVLLDSGIRAGELLKLKVTDVNPQESTFVVTGKGKTRTVVIGSFARRELWAYLAHHRLKLDTQETALFVSMDGIPLKYWGLRMMFQRIRERTGIERVSLRPHICRHTFATKAHRNGMRGAVLQEVLGHSSFDTTRRFYLDVSTEDLKAEHQLYGPLDNMGGTLRTQQTGRIGPIQLPDALALAREVKATNYRTVARKYGVSDTAIRKRLKKAGLL